MLRKIGFRSTLIWLAAIAFLIPTRSWGQGSDLGTIRGAVSDNSGARIPRVTVTIVHRHFSCTGVQHASGWSGDASAQ